MHPHEYQKIKAASCGQVDPRLFGLTRPVYTVAETLDLLHIGRTAFYSAVKDGSMRIVKRGRSTLVYADDIAAYLTNLRNAA